MPDVNRKIGHSPDAGDGVTGRTGEQAPRYFANLLNQRLDELDIEPQKRASWLASLDDIERPAKKIVAVSNATEWLNRPRLSWLNPGSYRNLSHHLRMPGLPLVEATSLELNITWGGSKRPTASWVPTAFNHLPDEDRDTAMRVFRETVEGLARARGIDR